MKDNMIKGMFLAFLAAVGLTGCANDNGVHDFENRVYILESSFAPQIRVATDENADEMSSSVSVGMADFEAEDVTVNFRPAPELLEQYRLAYYDESAELLTEEHYDIPELTVTIPAGSVKSPMLDFNFKKLMSLEYSKNYVLPVTIESTSGPAVLESASTIYFVIKEASLINVVADINANCAWPDWEKFDEVAGMETFTMEALIKANAFTNKEIHTIMGIEDCFLVRVGDRNIPKNQLQVATCRYDKENNTSYRADVTGPKMKLETDRWYHIAVTFDRGLVKVYIDGRLSGEGDFSEGEIKLTSVNFKVKHSDESEGQPRCFWIGYSYNDERPFNGSISEVRMWKRALSEDEINSPKHFYKINLKDDDAKDGLVAYWKFNDNSGNKVKDHSGFNNDLTSKSSLVWKEVELPAKDKL